MNAKKNPKLDLEKRRMSFLYVGLLTAGSLTLAAFRWGTPVPEGKHLENKKPEITTEIYEVKQIEKKQPFVQEKPQIRPQIYNPDSVKVVDKEPKKPILTSDSLPKFIDFTAGKKGLGDLGITTKPDPTIVDEWDVEESPQFPGGDVAMAKYIQKNFKMPQYSHLISKGTVYIKFVVTADGDLSNITIERGLSEEIDREALRTIESMPKWTPGKYRGRKVAVRMVIPIKIVYQ
jgi:protein TonB